MPLLTARISNGGRHHLAWDGNQNIFCCMLLTKANSPTPQQATESYI